MKIRTVIGLGAIGGLLYLHRRRGGEWTFDSLRDSAQMLWDGIERAAEKARREVESKAREAAKEVGSAAREGVARAQATTTPSGNGRH